MALSIETLYQYYALVKKILCYHVKTKSCGTGSCKQPAPQPKGLHYLCTPGPVFFFPELFETPGPTSPSFEGALVEVSVSGSLVAGGAAVVGAAVAGGAVVGASVGFAAVVGSVAGFVSAGFDVPLEAVWDSVPGR